VTLLSIITLAKQLTGCYSVAAPQGDGATDDLQSAFEAEVTRELMDHFNNRWGQGAPVLKAEAELVSSQLWQNLRNLVQ
jgi:hypothetical protein